MSFPAGELYDSIMLLKIRTVLQSCHPASILYSASFASILYSASLMLTAFVSAPSSSAVVVANTRR